MQFIQPSNFGKSNIVLKGNESDVVDMPAYRDNGMVLTKWKLPFLARLSIFLHGNLWITCQGNTQPPMSVIVCEDIFDHEPVEDDAKI